MPPTGPEPRFSEETSTDIVVARLTREDSRLANILALLTRHLHEVVRESRPTQAEWKQVVRFLTEVGHASDDRRQEWVLLSDLLGLTALVEEINSPRPLGATPNTPRGPFYRASAPRYADGANISLDGAGETLDVTCRVTDLDGRPISGATIETWQANSEGRYENQQPDQQPDFNLRGSFVTDAKGEVRYRSIRPAGYSVPVDGPVGKLLGGIGYPTRRPAHLQFIVRADGFEPITTHVYDSRDPAIAEDAILAVREELLGDFRRRRSPGGTTLWTLDYTFVMARMPSKRRAA